jgi:hypothetical protein
VNKILSLQSSRFRKMNLHSYTVNKALRDVRGNYIIESIPDEESDSHHSIFKSPLNLGLHNTT